MVLVPKNSGSHITGDIICKISRPMKPRIVVFRSRYQREPRIDGLFTRHKKSQVSTTKGGGKFEGSLLECLWRGEIEKKRWRPVRRHKRTRTRTRATSSRLVSPAQPSTTFVPRIEVSREPFPCPVATRPIAVRPRSVEKTELFWHCPHLLFVFEPTGRSASTPRRRAEAPTACLIRPTPRS